jgi:hypothetical protein
MVGDETSSPKKRIVRSTRPCRVPEQAGIRRGACQPSGLDLDFGHVSVLQISVRIRRLSE